MPFWMNEWLKSKTTIQISITYHNRGSVRVPALVPVPVGCGVYLCTDDQRHHGLDGGQLSGPASLPGLWTATGGSQVIRLGGWDRIFHRAELTLTDMILLFEDFHFASFCYFKIYVTISTLVLRQWNIHRRLMGNIPPPPHGQSMGGEIDSKSPNG